MSAGRAQQVSARALYGFGSFLARTLPERAALGLAYRVADGVTARRTERVLGMEANLRRVVGPDLPEPELQELVRQAMRSYMRYWAEVFRLPSWGPELLEQRCVVDGFEHIEKAHADGRGVVIALPHCANWDLAGAWISAQGMPFATVAERLEPEALFRRFVAHREALGMEVHPLDDGAAAFGALLRHVRSGGVVCLPSDRDLTDSGIEVTFFGGRARMPGGPAALAVATGAALFAIELRYDGPVMRIRVDPPLEVPSGGSRRDRVAALTQRVAGVFEASIAANPQDWHVTQSVWVDELEAPPVAGARGAG